MRIAVFGDIHGHWRGCRDAVADIHARTPLDLVLQCGDAQPFRDEADLEYMACPTRYRELGDFWMFHQGKEHFPVPMLLIGGNHEPWNLFDQNPDGCELAPNIEFIGRAGLRKVKGLKIVGLSGIYSKRYFAEPHLRWPYPLNLKKQVTHYNSTDIDKALSFGQPDILLTHEWPRFMLEAYYEKLPRRRDGDNSEDFAAMVECLSPRWCFCGHMHFHAEHQHGRTHLIGLSAFNYEPENACLLLDTETGTCEWPLTNK